MGVSGAMDTGGYFYSTLPHELGHAMGLAHPHNGGGAWSGYFGKFGSELYPGLNENQTTAGGENYLNSTPYSVMTYNDTSSYLTTNNTQGIPKYVTPGSSSNFGFNESLGAFDIATIQYLYGPNTTKSTGNNTYYLDTNTLNGYKTIWDNGGIDTISAANSSAAVKIGLRSATLQNEAGGGGYLSRVDNQYIGYTIAYNTTGTATIENAFGSIHNDKINGNSTNNTINGSVGDDTLVGGTGDDVYLVDSASDVIIEVDGQGTDLIQAASTSAGTTFTVADNVENLTLSDDVANVTGNAK